MFCYHCGADSFWSERDGEVICLLCSRVQNPVEPLPYQRDVFLPGLWKAKDRGGYTRGRGITNPILDDRGKYKRKERATKP